MENFIDEYDNLYYDNTNIHDIAADVPWIFNIILEH